MAKLSLSKSNNRGRSSTRASDFNMAASRCSAFAQEQLAKHGWKDGQGLGRTESGISEAIKVKIKHDTAGVGHDLGEQFTYHWWDHVFNKAASNIVVEKDQDGVKVSRKEVTQGPISNKKRDKTMAKKPLLYGNFVKAATLTPKGLQREAGGASPSSSSSSEDEVPHGEENIDERFFKACGGRTAHKGARHGLTLSGKLKRIQAQEEGSQLPGPLRVTTDATMNPGAVTAGSDRALAEVQQLVQKDATERKKKKKKKRRADKEEIAEHSIVENGTPDLGADYGDVVHGRKKCKKSKRAKRVEKDEPIHHEYSADDVIEEPDSHREKLQKCKRKGVNDFTESHEYSSGVDKQELDSCAREKRKKRSRKGKGENGIVESHEYSTDDVTGERLDDHFAEKSKKHKKKKKDKNGLMNNHEYSSNDVIEEELDIDKREKKRKRKKAKNDVMDNHEYSMNDVIKETLDSHVHVCEKQRKRNKKKKR